MSICTTTVTPAGRTTDLNTDHSAQRNWVIVGADGGIGRALLDARLRSDAADASGQVVASGRREICSTDPRLHWLQLDYENDNGDQFASDVASRLDRIDTLVIATGLLHAAGLAPEKNINALTAQKMQRLFAVNAAGPLQTLARLTPLLKRSAQPRVAILSAQVGSIEDNQLGGWYSYRMSKAALNMGIKTAAIEIARWRNSPVLIAVHPGTTHSGLSKPFVQRRKAPVQTADAAALRLLALEQSLRPEQHGSFVTLDAKSLPW